MSPSKKISRNELEELHTLLQNNPDISVDSEEIQNSIFYKDMKDVTNLNVDCLHGSIEVLLLVAKIAAISPSLHTLSAFWYGLGDNSVAFAEAISASTSLQTLDVSNNEIGANAPAFAAAISTSTSLQTLDVAHNDIGAAAPEFAEAISALPSLHTLNVVLIIWALLLQNLQHLLVHHYHY
jgi:Leucine-rich repeat (LRR) protein